MILLIAIATAFSLCLLSIPEGLFWDDVAALRAADDLRFHLFDPDKWGPALAVHPPIAFLPHVVFSFFSPRYFAALGHVMQLGVFAGLIFAIRNLASGHSSPSWKSAAAIVLTMPFVLTATQVTTPDLLVGVLGTMALAALMKHQSKRAFAFFTCACLFKLTAVAFWPAIAFLVWESGERKWAKLIAFTAPVFVPFGWAAYWYRYGVSSINIETMAKAGPLGTVKLWVVYFLRHVLELSVFDLRWVVVLVLVPGYFTFRAVSVDRTSTLTRISALTIVSGLVVVSVFGGSASLQRYFLVGAVSLGIVISILIQRAWGSRSVYALGVVVIANLLGSFVPVLTKGDHWFGRQLPAFGKFIDSNPRGVRSFLALRKQVVTDVAASPLRIESASWPLQVFLSDRRAGFLASAPALSVSPQSSCIPSGETVLIDSQSAPVSFLLDRSLVHLRTWSDGNSYVVLAKTLRTVC